MTNALIVVDVQKDFCEGGNLPLWGGNVVAQKISEYIDSLPMGSILAFTKDFHAPESDNGGHIALPPAQPDYVDTWPAHCIQGTEGADLNDALARFNDYSLTFYKGMGVPAYSGFEGFLNAATDGETLENFLNRYGVKEVEVVGIAADYCVKATAVDAIKNGFHTRVNPDLTVGIHMGGAEVAKSIEESQT